MILVTMVENKQQKNHLQILFVRDMFTTLEDITFLLG